MSSIHLTTERGAILATIGGRPCLRIWPESPWFERLKTACDITIRIVEAATSRQAEDKLIGMNCEAPHRGIQ